MTRRCHHHQSGNAVLLILLGVALFAALAYTFMRGSQQGQGNMSAQQAKIAAQEIRNSALNIDRAINKLVSRGCSQDQLSLSGTTNRTTTHYINTWAPSDGSCNVFGSNGGGVSDASLSTGKGQSSWEFGQNEAFEIKPGQWAYGIMALLPNISDQVCQAINNQTQNGWTNIPTYNTRIWFRYSPSLSLGIRPAPNFGWQYCSNFVHSGGGSCGSLEGCLNATDPAHAGGKLYFRYVYMVPTS